MHHNTLFCEPWFLCEEKLLILKTLLKYTYLRLINLGVKWDREGQEENQNYDEEVNRREDFLKVKVWK